MKIVIYPDERLRQISEPVLQIGEEERTILDAMEITMLETGGIGLSAIQIGINKQLIVIKDDKNNILKIANPRIIEEYDYYILPEGCLSLPGKTISVSRPNEILVEGIAYTNIPFKAVFYGIEARILCHEIDHLKGILIIDKKLNKVGRNELCPECLKLNIRIKHKKCKKHFNG